MAFPAWERFEGPDAADLGEEERESIAAAAVPVPASVAEGVVRLGDERRYGVPVLLVGPEYTPDQVQRWIEGGDVSELSRAKDVSYADIDSGHWPIVARPAEQAGILVAAGR